MLPLPAHAEMRSLELNLRLCDKPSLCGLEAVAQALSKLGKLNHLSLNWTPGWPEGNGPPRSDAEDARCASRVMP